MAHIAVNPNQSAGLFNRVAGAFEALKTRINRYALYRETLSELGAMSDRELADLGLSRSMIRRVAYHAAYEA